MLTEDISMQHNASVMSAWHVHYVTLTWALSDMSAGRLCAALKHVIKPCKVNCVMLCMAAHSPHCTAALSQQALTVSFIEMVACVRR